MKVILAIVVASLVSYCSEGQAQINKTFSYLGHHNKIEKEVSFEKDSLVSKDYTKKVEVVCRKQVKNMGRIEGNIKYSFKFEFLCPVDSFKFINATNNLKAIVKNYDRQLGRTIIIKCHLDFFWGYAVKDFAEEKKSYGRIFVEQLLDDHAFDKTTSLFNQNIYNAPSQLNKLVVFSKYIFGARLKSVSCSIEIVNWAKDGGKLDYLLVTNSGIRNIVREEQNRTMRSMSRLPEFFQDIFYCFLNNPLFLGCATYQHQNIC